MKTISQMMDILLAELVSELRRRERLDDLCAKSLYPGVSIPGDYGVDDCGGMAWVQLQSAAPSASFPVPATDLNTCSYSLAYTVSMGVMRPITLPEEGVRGDITLPSDEQNSASTYEQLEDMDAMHQAIKRASRSIDYLILGTYNPTGPEGGVVMGSWSLTVGNEDPE